MTVTDADLAEAIRIADEHGETVFVQNCRPKYKLVNLELEPDLELTDDEKIDVVAKRIMQRYKAAFLELAK
jgi:antitoxin Phd